MTALCGGGTSGPKAGVAETVIYTSAALASLLNNKGGWWAALAAPLLGVLAYEATELCSVDPPSYSAITPDEYLALLNLSPWDTLQTAVGKLADTVKVAIWHELCECKTVATPATPANLWAPPVGVVSPTATQGPCVRRTWRATASIRATSGTAVGADAFINVPMFPELATVNIDNNPGFEQPHAASVMPVPPYPFWNASATLVTAGNNAGQTASFQALSRAVTNGAWLGGPSGSISTAVPFRLAAANPIPMDSGALYFDMAFVQIGGTVPAVADVSMEFFCPGTSPVGAGPCQSDPLVIAMLSQLLELSKLVQRQQVPFAYVRSAEHVGLVGNGEIAVQGVLGCVVELTTMPTFLGLESGHPDLVFDAGWVNWGNADGFSAQQRIVNGQLVSLPPLAGQYTRVGYSFPPGVVATIAELTREP